jgi:hypothetical protein
MHDDTRIMQATRRSGMTVTNERVTTITSVKTISAPTRIKQPVWRRGRAGLYRMSEKSGTSGKYTITYALLFGQYVLHVSTHKPPRTFWARVPCFLEFLSEYRDQQQRKPP